MGERYFPALLAFLLLFAGCGREEAFSCAPVVPPGYTHSRSEADPPAPEPPPSAPEQEGALVCGWVAGLADAAAAPILAQGLSPVEEIRAAYRLLIEQTYFADPVGLETWRYHSDAPNEPIPYLENRALSPLAYGVGSCEDFAAALTVLLTRMGYPARYVSGLTISVRGDFVDHAWVMVALDGQWYHLDPQLEQNIVRDGLLTYRYFLRDDSFMLADHRWGQSLLDYYGAGISAEQRSLISQTMMHPACPLAWEPVPDPEPIRLPRRPDVPALRAQLKAQQEAFLAHSAPLPPLALDIIPPIYAVMPEPPPFVQNPLL